MQQMNSAASDWVQNFCGIDPRAASGAGGAPAYDGAGDEGASGSNGGTGAPSAGDQHRHEIEAAADARKAKRDAYTDEYGIAKPATPWTVKLTDGVAPPEI